MDLRWGYVVNVIGCAVLLLLGAWVAGRRPVRRENLAFGSYALGSTIPPLMTNLSLIYEVPYSTRFAIPAILGYLLVIAGVAGVAAWFPDPLGRRDRSLVLAAVGIGAIPVLLGLYRLATLGIVAPTSIIAPLSSPIHPVASIAGNLREGSLWAAITLFALRFATLPANSKRHTAYALLASALVIYPAINAPIQLQTALARGQVWTTGSVISCILAAIVGTLWLWNTRKATNGHLARNVALLTFTAPAVALAIGTQAEAYAWYSENGIGGFLRVVTVAILGYAILKHQLLGIDVKVRFAISKSTVAAIFIAVFFVASEAAQQFFGAKLGGTYVGIAAAGGLVFAIAPLQRLGERLAEKAVPGAPSPSAPIGAAQETAYRRAVRLALRDSDLSANEERELVLLAHDLGLAPARAFAIRDEVAKETP